ncbi:hypothetical protein BS50DRAFT_506005 [Corynespora cassiicola Philippines]|uniref:Velvet domain-containing protein n=1 Tax=Corynespora cassiicola Philippines TaxID=1448308 RepID=A0A2T2N6G6_CORCC|nr:hypothetical protein BS50DRAFT_506005 [Corynespora cassiicola Philippines]
MYAAPPPRAAEPHPLDSFVGRKNGRMYKLSVEQQPIRARMCGFGDKDRRPITPPPCIRLIVCDATTGKEVDFQEVDSTFFVLSVDLWDADGTREVNLVRHSSGAPTVSISSSTTTAYPPPVERPSMYMPQSIMAPPQVDAYGRLIPSHVYQSPAPAPNYSYPPGNPYAPPTQVHMPMQVAPPPPSAATGMFTRNLIGSLTVNAFRLTDTENKVGFWFVLQDLSVRTEGVFRLKMSFVDVGSGQGNNTLNNGRAPVLATCFSDQFQVYSAKKFPGVIESTPLSKAFAGQGIKIPIRKDGPKNISNQAEYDADD